ncbi:MAG: PAS domain-containing protein [Pseudomonadota bacterium]
MKPEMQTEKTFVLPKTTSIRRLVKAFTAKHKLTVAEGAVLQSHKEVELYSAIIQKLSQPVLIVNSDTKTKSCNEAFANLLGLNIKEFNKIEWAMDFTPPEWREITIANLEELQRTGRPISYEKEYIRKDKTLVPVELLVHLMVDENGQPNYYYVFATDITERKLAQDAIKESQQRYRSLFEEAPVMYVITRNNGGIPVIAECNKSFLNTLGYAISEVLEHPLSDFCTPESCIELLEVSVCRLVFSNRFVSEDCGLLTRDGRIIDTLLQAVPEKSVDGRTTGNRIMLVDVTAQKQTERQLQALSHRQKALLSAIPDIIVEVDANKVYTWANNAGIEFFGTDIIGKEASFYFTGNQNTYDQVDPLFNGSEHVIHLESWQKRKDGKIRLLEWWCRMLKDEHGNVKGALSTARDITEQIRTNMELGGKIEELERWNRAVLGRETRVIELKREVNKLLEKAGQPPRYADTLPKPDNCQPSTDN